MRVRQALYLVAMAATVATTLPARAQMAEPNWISDVKWRASLGTGVGLETGGVQPKDPFLLYFGGNVRKSWRWWYGLTFKSRVDLYTGIVDCPMVPYKIDGDASLALGPAVFRMEVASARIRSDFGGVCNGYSKGTDFRLDASTLPTFTGDVAVDGGRHILTYFAAPLQVSFGHWNPVIQPGIQAFNFRPYTGGTFRFKDRWIVSDFIQLYGGLTFYKAWSNRDTEAVFNLGGIVGILENAVQFGLDLAYDYWVTAAGMTENITTFTLSARLRSSGRRRDLGARR